MSTDRDTTRIVRSWLEEGVTALPDRVLDTVLDQVPATPQRRSWWPARRFAPMNVYAKLGVAAAAIVVVVLSYSLLSGSPIGGPPAPTLTPPPSSGTNTVAPGTQAPTPVPTPIPLSGTNSGPGTFVAGTPFPVAITATIPAGWQGGIGGPYLVAFGPSTGQTGGLQFARFSLVAVDPCHASRGYVNVAGATVADLATAIGKIPGITVSRPAGVTFKGYTGKQLTITAPVVPATCTLGPDGYALWKLPLGAVFALSSTESAQLWILDVNGTRLVIVLQDFGLTTAQIAQAQAILDSVSIGSLN